MEKRISLQNVGIQFHQKIIFQNISFSIQENQDVCLIGLEGVGKSLLLQAILGKVSFFGEILKEAPCRGLLTLSKNESSSIQDYLNYSTLNEKDQAMVKQFLKLKSLQYSLSKLNSFFRLNVFLLKEILNHPKFFIFDDVLSFLKPEEKQEIFDFLHRIGITILFVTSNMEDVLFFPYCVVMGENGILMEGKSLLVLQEEKLLKRLGFSLPFYIDLSLQLKSYGLIESVFTSGKELTNHLWKSN